MATMQCQSLIGADGKQYFLVFAEEPIIDKYDLWQGGKCLEFDFDHKKQTTKVSSFWWYNGMPTGWKHIKTFKDEILGDEECLKFADSYFASESRSQDVNFDV